MVWRGIGAFAAVVVLGVVAGHVATADDQPSTHTITLGAASLTLSGGWHAVDATTLADGRRHMRIAVGAPADASLVPPALRTAARDVPPKPARLGGYRAWSYGTLTVLPTTRGVLGVACAPAPCATAIRSVSIPGATILTPTRDLALRLRAPAPLAALDAARTTARTTLQHTPTATEPLTRIAAAHHTALEALRPLVAASSPRGSLGAGGALVAALAGGERAYDRLAGARSTPGFATARGEVVAADRAVDAAVGRLARAGTPATQAPTPADAGRGGGASLLTLLLVLASALLVSALAPACLSRLRARPSRRLEAPKACVLEVRGRTPIVPPPTYGRWNEPPRGPDAALQDGARESAMGSSSTA